MKIIAVRKGLYTYIAVSCLALIGWSTIRIAPLPPRAPFVTCHWLDRLFTLAFSAPGGWFVSSFVFVCFCFLLLSRMQRHQHSRAWWRCSSWAIGIPTYFTSSETPFSIRFARCFRGVRLTRTRTIDRYQYIRSMYEVDFIF